VVGPVTALLRAMGRPVTGRLRAVGHPAVAGRLVLVSLIAVAAALQAAA
jgi:hypothetical protein